MAETGELTFSNAMVENPWSMPASPEVHNWMEPRLEPEANTNGAWLFGFGWKLNTVIRPDPALSVWTRVPVRRSQSLMVLSPSPERRKVSFEGKKARASTFAP